MHRRLVVAVVAVALVVGGGAAWVWDAHARDAAGDRSRDRVAVAVAVGGHDEQAAVDLADRSAGLVGRGAATDALAALSQAVPAAQAVLDGSAGKVADDAVRQQLAAVIDAARTALAGSVAPARADDLTGSLSTAAGAVTAAQQAWEADQASQAAKATAVATASASARATPSALDSCATTYEGPPFYTSVPATTGTGTNGDLPASEMTELSWAGTDSLGNGYWLRKDAAAALTALDAAFEPAFGHHLDIDLSYRDLQTQKDMLAALGPNVAAQVGTSHHGAGTAIDVPELPCEYGRHTPQRDWLVTHGPAYGWHPDPNEYWHFDYRP